MTGETDIAVMGRGGEATGGFRPWLFGSQNWIGS